MFPDKWQEDKMHEECGIFGIYAPHVTDTYTLSKFGLFALQHRGQEAAGIATLSKNGRIKIHKGEGLVAEVFDRTTDSEFEGIASIGHVRYSTTGGASSFNIQPLYVTDENKHIKLAVTHNGNLTNADELREELKASQFTMMSTSDSEVILKFIYKYLASMSLEEAIIQTTKKIQGAYSLLVLSDEKLIVVRDPNAIRPLCMGRINHDTYVFSSETCGLDAVNAKLEKFLDAGEMIVCEQGKEIRSIQYTQERKHNFCSFEYIYFSRPDSIIEGTSAYTVREQCGRMLYQQRKIEADIIVGVPDSGIPAAIGYSAISGIPFKPVLIKNKYMGRSFIAPTQQQRELVVNLKLNIIPSEIENQRVIIIDDSIVRGTTSRYIVNMFREAKAKEVHFLSASPGILYPCFLGINTPSQDKLISANHTNEEISEKINADSVGFLALENLHKILDKTSYCYGCFSGDYPVNKKNA